MKKLYTLLAAAVVVASASAAPATVAKSAIKANKVEKELVIKSADALKAQPVQASAKPNRKPMAKEAAGTVAGQYLAEAWGVLGNATSASWNELDAATVEVDGNKVTITDFVVGGYTVEGTLSEDGTEIIVEAGQMGLLYGEAGYPVTVFVMDMETEAIEDEIVLKYNAAAHTIDWEAADDGQYYLQALVLAEGLGDEDLMYGYFFVVNWGAVNSIMTFNLLVSQAGDLEEFENYIYAYANDDCSKIYITNMYAALFNSNVFALCELEVDAVNMTATATDQQVANPNTSNAYYLWGYDDAGMADDTVVTYNIESFPAEGYSVLSADYVGIIKMDFSSGGTAYFTDILLPFVIESRAGVDNVAVDANAPVEYFNLQGVRVANPENGLYIRRQGNSVSKVLVK